MFPQSRIDEFHFWQNLLLKEVHLPRCQGRKLVGHLNYHSQSLLITPLVTWLGPDRHVSSITPPSLVLMTFTFGKIS